VRCWPQRSCTSCCWARRGPFTFFVWITALADAAAAAAPFTQPAPLASKVFTAVINVVVGVAVISLLYGVGRSSVRPVRGEYQPVVPDMNWR
jgi:hypothetical protein